VPSKLDLKETQTRNLFGKLIDYQRFDLIELMAKADRKEIKVVKIKRQLVGSLAVHNAIVHYLKMNDVEVIQ